MSSFCPSSAKVTTRRGEHAGLNRSAKGEERGERRKEIIIAFKDFGS